MNYYNQQLVCRNCLYEIDYRVFIYSSENFGYSLCMSCQNWLRDIFEFTSATDLAVELYFALRDRGVPAELEKNDGFKTIDIAIPDAKVNLEVDGIHHNQNPYQALIDLKRTLESYKKGFTTLRIPNALVKNDLDETADLITKYLIVSRDRNNQRKKY